MKLTEGVLQSGRCVQVDYDKADDTITVEVVELDKALIARSRTIPVRSRTLFRRSLVERIRRAIIECDEEIEASMRSAFGLEQKLADAAWLALYYPPGYQLPPLARPPTDPAPPAYRRAPERGIPAGPQVQPPPRRPPPTDPPE